MKVLLDHNLSKKIRNFLPGHLVRTAKQEGWSALLNGDLLRAAEAAAFEVMLTADQEIFHQHNHKHRGIALVVLTSNKWVLIEPLGDAIRTAVERSRHGSYETVKVPLPSKSR